MVLPLAFGVGVFVWTVNGRPCWYVFRNGTQFTTKDTGQTSVNDLIEVFESGGVQGGEPTTTE